MLKKYLERPAPQQTQSPWSPRIVPHGHTQSSGTPQQQLQLPVLRESLQGLL